MEAKQTGAIHVPPGEGRSLWVAGFPHTLKATGEDTNGVYSVLEVSVGPQAGPPPHIHHWEDEALYILEGEFEIMDNGNTTTARPGSFVHIPKGTLHCFKNVGETPARMLALFTPAGFEGFFVAVGQPAKEGQDAPPLGPEEIEKTIAVAPKYGMEVPPPPGT